MKAITALTVLFCAAVSASAAPFVKPISNISQPTSGYYTGIGGSQREGISFVTGSGASLITNVMISMNNAGDSSFGPFTLALYSDVAGSPGINQLTLSGNTTPFDAGTYTYTAPSAFTLQADTTYWLVAASPTTSGGGYTWNGTPSTSLDSGSTWTLGVAKYDSDGSWATDAGFSPLFAVSIIPIPEPSSGMLFGGGLSGVFALMRIRKFRAQARA